MQGEDFTKISAHYDKTSVVQLSASEMLVKLLSPKPGEKVLDVGCGTGKITARLEEIAGKGNVKGVDASEGMIATAGKNHPSIGFEVAGRRRLEVRRRVRRAVLQFHVPVVPRAGEGTSKVLRRAEARGRAGIQSPATKEYCGQFIDAVNYAAASDPVVGEKYKSFRLPWYFLDTAAEYAALFERCGFKVEHATIEEVPATYTAGQAYEVFSSGAAAGYLGAEYYGVPIDEDYAERFSAARSGVLSQERGLERQLSLCLQEDLSHRGEINPGALSC
jgi:trans-aconitate methyltransferase